MKNYPLAFVLLNEMHNFAVSKAKFVQLFGESVCLEKDIKLTMNQLGSKVYYGRVDLEKVQEKSNIANNKVNRANQLIKFISWIPWIKLIAISGSIAFDNASESDDIDIFIVTDANRVWITRFIEASIFICLNVRRRCGQVNVKDRLCFNYYLGAGFDRWSESQNFMTAVELVSLKPIIGEDFYQSLLLKNKWVIKYFPGLKNEIKKYPQYYESELKQSLIGKFLDKFDLVLMKIQLFYMKSRGHQNKKCKITRNEICFYEEDWDEKKRILEKNLNEFKSL